MVKIILHNYKGFKIFENETPSKSGLSGGQESKEPRIAPRLHLGVGRRQPQLHALRQANRSGVIRDFPFREILISSRLAMALANGRVFGLYPRRAGRAYDIHRT
jgi:hypothetical protein